jgi:diguanylate cyclase (GGDEF)-like protein
MGRTGKRDELLDRTLLATEALSAATTAAKLTEHAVEGLTAVLDCERCFLLRFDDGVLVGLDDPDDRPVLREGEVAAAASALHAGVPRLLHQETASVGLDGLPAGGRDTVTALALPVRLSDGQNAVAICSWPDDAGTPDAERVRFAMLVCSVAGAVGARIETASQLVRLGETDPLTGAHTRAGLDTMLAALRAASSPHAVVLIDVDAFGAYNERRGRDSGDRLLVALAGLVGRECREGDVVARAGADEFALVLPGSTTDAGRAAAVRIVEAVADWGHEDVVTVSAGVGAVIADSDVDAMRLAAKALAKAKEDGEGNAVGVA